MPFPFLRTLIVNVSGDDHSLQVIAGYLVSGVVDSFADIPGSVFVVLDYEFISLVFEGIAGVDGGSGFIFHIDGFAYGGDVYLYVFLFYAVNPLFDEISVMPDSRGVSSSV